MSPQGLNQDIVDILSELTEFVNDGIAGYERAVRESQNPEFRAYYQNIAHERRDFSDQLNNLIRQYGGTAEKGTTIKGKFYRQWMDVKAAFTGADERAILDSNLYGEEWAQKAFTDALEHRELPSDVRSLIERQRDISLREYNQLKVMRDSIPS